MRITLTETDIQDALKQYISQMGVDLSGKRVEVTMTAGRGTNGHTANLEILPLDLVDDPADPYPLQVPLAADDSTGTEEEQQAIPFDWKQAEA